MELLKIRSYLDKYSLKNRSIFALFLIIFILLAIVIIQGIFLNRDNHVCSSPSCVKLASTIYSGIDWNIDPCENFYDFVCGKWSEENPTAYSFINLIEKENEELTYKLLDEELPKNPTKADENLHVYYKSCLNNTHRNALGAKPLVDLIGSWPNFESSERFSEFVINLHKKVFSVGLFTIDSGDDKYNRSKFIYTLEPGRLALPNETFYLNETGKPVVQELSKFLKNISILLGGLNDFKTSEKIQEIIDFEIELAKIIPNQTLDSDEYYDPIGLEKVQEIATFMNWTTYFSSQFELINKTLDENFTLSISDSNYFRNLSTLIEQMEESDKGRNILNNYLTLHVILALSSCLSNDFSKVLTALENMIIESPLYSTSIMGDKLHIEWCSDSCYKETLEAFEETIGAKLIRKNLAKHQQDKELLDEMYAKIQTTFLSQIDGYDWIDSETKKAIKLKASEIKKTFIFPESILNPQHKAEKHDYYYPMNSTDYFGNFLKTMRGYYRDLYRKYFRTMNFNLVGTTTGFKEIHFQYLNLIWISLGATRPYTIDSRFPKSILYGHYGDTIAHEIMHAFDNKGLLYSGNGSFTQTWTNKSIENYKKKLQCFHKQLPGKEDMIGEIIADNGGLNLAFKTFQTLESSDKIQLPHLNFTQNQLFFVIFARYFCTSEPDTDSTGHPAERYRVQYSLSNNRNFASAFNCPNGANYNLKDEDKCIVW